MVLLVCHTAVHVVLSSLNWSLEVILTEAIFGDGGRSLWEISQRIQEGSVISKALWSNTAFNLY